MSHTAGKLEIDQWGGCNTTDGTRLLLTGVSLSLGNDPRTLAEDNTARVVATWNACAGLTPEQVAAIPRLIEWFTRSDDILNQSSREAMDLYEIFPLLSDPRRDA